MCAGCFDKGQQQDAGRDDPDGPLIAEPSGRPWQLCIKVQRHRETSICGRQQRLRAPAVNSTEARGPHTDAVDWFCGAGLSIWRRRLGETEAALLLSTLPLSAGLEQLVHERHQGIHACLGVVVSGTLEVDASLASTEAKVTALHARHEGAVL